MAGELKVLNEYVGILIVLCLIVLILLLFGARLDVSALGPSDKRAGYLSGSENALRFESIDSATNRAGLSISQNEQPVSSRAADLIPHMLEAGETSDEPVMSASEIVQSANDQRVAAGNTDVSSRSGYDPYRQRSGFSERELVKSLHGM